MTRFFHFSLPLILLPLMSWGFLGEQTQFRSQLRVQNSPSVVQLDEATDAAGVVRQVRWNGPHHPNFKQALGVCYDQLAQKLKYNARARGPAVLKVSNAKCSLSIGGRLGQVYGEAQLK